MDPIFRIRLAPGFAGCPIKCFCANFDDWLPSQMFYLIATQRFLRTSQSNLANRWFIFFGFDLEADTIGLSNVPPDKTKS